MAEKGWLWTATTQLTATCGVSGLRQCWPSELWAVVPPRLGCFEGFGPSQVSTSAILYLTFYTIQAAMIVGSLSMALEQCTSLGWNASHVGIIHADSAYHPALVAQGTEVLFINSIPCCHASTPTYIMGFNVKIDHERIQTTHLHASRCHRCTHCHCCNVDFVSFHTCFY